MNQTIQVSLEGPANALALNKDYSQVVIAGRNGNFGIATNAYKLLLFLCSI